MIKNLLLTSSLIGLTFSSLFAQRAMGEIIDLKQIDATPRQVHLSERSFGDLPKAASVEQWCPTPGDQKTYGTCAAWATAYGMATILYAKTHNITDKSMVNKYAFSPTHQYERIKQPGDNTCQGGSNTIGGLYTIYDKGVALLSTVPYACNVSISNAMNEEALKYKFSNLNILYGNEELAASLKDNTLIKSDQEKLDLNKLTLSSGYPIAISFTLPQSFQKVNSKVWHSDPNETPAQWKHASHAMVIVAYDDNVDGGAFKVLNSWGTGFGDNGFIWIRYADFTKFVKYAAIAFPDPNSAPPAEAPKPKPDQPKPAAETTFELSGSVDFKLNTGDDMPIQRTSTRNLTVEDDEPQAKEDLVAYTMAQTYGSGTKFRFYMTVDKDAFVYAFATDLKGKVNRILPFDDKVSTRVVPNSVIAFPSDSKVVKMDEEKGRDYLLILYSAVALDSKDIAEKMNGMTGAFSDKIKSVLGNKLIDKSKIEYHKDKVGFSTKKISSRNLTVEDDEPATPTGGSVVPLMVEIKHN
ncbi:MAG TPA: C1 family peptidase [Niabella sp.]|nr:C1 family peptidase [Niabella sp.]HQW14548.1 C1 family peptidase [Niabella sp.]HQX19689.1 C1 family peptidase [Niabella sp.]HQX42823.1 C1 family peptidase [Niabella sp.]HRB07574.1 C1 family peptidase [Niabella sp.]